MKSKIFGSEKSSDTLVVLSEVSNPSLYINKKSYDPKTRNYFGKIIEIDVQKNKCVIKKDLGGKTEKRLDQIMVYKNI